MAKEYPPTGDHGEVLGREFLRVSRDKSGEATSNSEQHDDNHEVWAEEGRIPGLRLGRAYEHVGSASEWSTTVQRAFNDLVDDLEKDRFGAKFLILWEASRLSRQVAGWVGLIGQCRRRGVLIAITDDQRIYDPNDGQDHYELINKANEAQHESWRIKRRCLRTRKRQRKEGRPHGRCPFGYARRYEREADERGRSVLRPVQYPDPGESPVVAELFRRFLAGEAIYGIAKDFERRGVVKRSGTPFSDKEIRELLTRPVYAGLRDLDHGGQWEAIVAPADWHVVQNRLAERSRNTPRTVRDSVLCSGIVRCDVCGKGMRRKRYAPSHRRADGPKSLFYQCVSGHVTVPHDELDAAVTRLVVAYLADPGNADRWATPESSDAELAEVRDTIAGARAQLAKLDADIDADVGGELDPYVTSRMRATIIRRRDRAVARERGLTAPSSVTRLFGHVGSFCDVETRWAALDVAVRRELLKIVLTAQHAGQLRITRARRERRATPVVERLRLARDEEADVEVADAA